ncbi:MAG: cbb3-type cytochrome c oxidase subunit 3 [Vannielia sp.]|uniref:cbb3-type cytochrome c oxidase subunit 3 n=1 Tax=Rhodobacterales TaxID=204455 RepID=UPI002094DC72|nr:cbb3-type cytochrome c oxidase subunit 3 [Oceanicola sp. 502str15]MCO6384549.1 CcoQ/FixQ family Cbb3-type cytochrome c oxidase assembly chaperone [Oceanicola sp. 502str15]
METYSWMRELADSWVLLAMFLFFAGVVLWAFRPGSRRDHEECANLIFRNDRTPAGEGSEGAKK